MRHGKHKQIFLLTTRRSRAEVIDFTAPYFHSGVSLLAAPKTKSEIPLLAFLLPFSPELWIAIFTSLNITAVAVAVYEWLSPFGLNPWGRQRSKNFSMSSGMYAPDEGVGESDRKTIYANRILNFNYKKNMQLKRKFFEFLFSYPQRSGLCGDYYAATWSHSKHPNRGQTNS